MKATVVGYREGPVRMIRLVKRHTPLLLGLSTPETVRTELYGAHQAEWRDEAGYTLDMKRLIARSVIEDRFKLTRATQGSTFVCEGGARGRLGEKGDGRPLPLEKAHWWGVTGPSGSFYVRYELQGKATQKILFRNGQEGSAGWQLDVLSMDGRILPLVTRMIFPSGASKDDPSHLAGIGAPEPRARIRTAAEIAGRRPLWFGPSGPPQPKRIARRYDVVTLTGYRSGWASSTASSVSPPASFAFIPRAAGASYRSRFSWTSATARVDTCSRRGRRGPPTWMTGGWMTTMKL